MVGQLVFTSDKAALVATLHAAFKEHGPFMLSSKMRAEPLFQKKHTGMTFQKSCGDVKSIYRRCVAQDVEEKTYDGEQAAGPEAYWMARQDKTTIPLYISFLEE